VLVKTFGREVFVNRVVELIEESTHPIVVTESIGGEEYEKLIKKLEKSDLDVILIPVNIRRESEKPGIDIRKLLPDITNINGLNVKSLEVNNNGTIEDFEESLRAIYIWYFYAYCYKRTNKGK